MNTNVICQFYGMTERLVICFLQTDIQYVRKGCYCRYFFVADHV